MADRTQLLIYRERIQQQLTALQSHLVSLSAEPPEEIDGANYAQWQDLKESLGKTILIGHAYLQSIVSILGTLK